MRPAPSSDRRDIAVVDLDSLTVRPLGERAGTVVASGRRVVAVLDKLSEWWAPGMLYSLDLATGARTLLAGNATEFVLTPACPGCDPTAPGAALSYVVQARVPFRYDGLWRAALP
jgi:hypothetical protein